MKLKNLSISVALGICVLVLFLQSSCPKCKDAFEAADLIVSGVEQNRSEESDSTIVFNIIHTVLNSVDDLVCDDASVETAPEHENKLPLIYSPDGNFESNSNEVGSKTVKANSLIADSTYKMQSDIVFEVDGFYNLISELDINENVTERNTKNNKLTTPVGVGKSNQPNSNIIEVRNTGRKTPLINKSGKPIYYSSWTIKIIE